MDLTTEHSLVSVITPSYNQARFLEETILSVLSQSYQPIEYLIIDGGSTDGSVDIIRRYAEKLAYWISEPDQGQSEAINKGILNSNGEFVAWLNADDCYYPWTVAEAIETLHRFPQAGMVHGHHSFMNERSEIIDNTLMDIDRSEFVISRLMNERDFINQPTVFIRRTVLEKVGLLRNELHYAMDYDLWLRIGKLFPVVFVNRIQARYRLHEAAKTTPMPFELATERYEICQSYGENGLGSAMSVLLIRWRNLARKTALDGPRSLLDDYSSKEFSRMPVEIRKAAKAPLTIGLLDGAYICMRENKPEMAVHWLASVFRFSPSQALKRGTWIYLMKAFVRVYLQ
jgi:glycosyltransferase involved in cell wall biosynthesis